MTRSNPTPHLPSEQHLLFLNGPADTLTGLYLLVNLLTNQALGLFNQ